MKCFWISLTNGKRGAGMRNYLSSEALFDTWSEMLKATLFGDKEVTFEWHGDMNKQEPFWLYFEAFKHFFETDIEPKVIAPTGPASQEIWKYIDESARPVRDGAKALLKFQPEKKFDICFSFAEFEICNKGLTPKAISLLNMDGVKLRDSRNFESVDEIIETFDIILQSKMFVGTKCSWSRLAAFFDLETLRVIQDYPIMSFR